jgi:hypothetical protein
MMYMPDAIRATIDLMEAPAAQVKERRSYNLAGLSFSPEQIATELLRSTIPGLQNEIRAGRAPGLRRFLARPHR